MPKGEGFDVMDVSTRVHKDAKFRALANKHPDLVAPAFLVYVAALGESWAEGSRVPIQEAWPTLIPYRDDVVAALVEQRLVDKAGRVSMATWDDWFGTAFRRREASRERWRRANAHRAGTSGEPRGDREATAATVPLPLPLPVNTPSPAAGGEDQGRRTNGSNPRAKGTNPRAKGANPRAKGTSPRQAKERQDRAAPQRLGDILDRLGKPGGEAPEW